MSVTRATRGGERWPICGGELGPICGGELGPNRTSESSTETHEVSY